MACFLRRAAARLIDYLLWGMLTVTVLGSKAGEFQSPSLFFYASFWIYLFVEASLVSSFATTAGKRLLGIYIFDQNEKKLSFGHSLKRSFLVFGVGLGFFLPYVSLVLPICVIFWIVKRRSVPWDTIAQDVVACVKPTVTDKVLLTCFVAFLATGYFITLRIAFLHREPDFSVMEESIFTSYTEEIRPQLVQTLSEEAVLTPQAAAQAIEELSKIQLQLQHKKEELDLMNNKLQKQFDKMSIRELKEYRQNQLNTVFKKLDSFLFSEKMRISLFESILEFFKSAREYTIVDGFPVFKDTEAARQYDNYMMQLQTFLLLEPPYKTVSFALPVFGSNDPERIFLKQHQQSK